MLSNKYFQEQDFKCEVWRRIPGYDGYAISNIARVKNISTGQMLKPRIEPRVTTSEHYAFNLYKDGSNYKISCRRLMATVGFEDDVIPPQDLEFELNYEKAIGGSNNTDRFIYNCF